MADKRMFSKSIVLSDEFLDMPATTRCLYFTLSMLADDDGFVNNPKSIMRQSMATEDDMKILFSKYFLIPFDSGIVAIRHWRINNYLRKDRYIPTKYVNEKSHILIGEDGSYQKIEDAEKKPLIDEKNAEVVSVENKVEIKETDSDKKLKEKESKEVEKKNKKPLVERVPQNDIEIVEKEYLMNYKKLHEAGILRSKSPIINWNVSRKLTKENIKKYGLETVLNAVKKSAENKFCIQKGYSLTTIMSSGVLSELINGCLDPPKKKVDLSEKYDMSDLIF